MPTFNRAHQSRLYEAVTSQLREAILAGEYKPGDRLPSEKELMELFGVSRAVARQATMHLEHQGLVNVQVGSGGGAFVSESGIESVLHAFENLLRHRGVELEDYLGAKRLFEPALAEAILRGVEASDFEALEDNLVRAGRAKNREAGNEEQLELSLEFHEILVTATHNPVIEALFIALVRIAQRVPSLTSPMRTEWETVLAEHEEMLSLLRRSSPEFGAALLDHLDSVNRIYR